MSNHDPRVVDEDFLDMLDRRGTDPNIVNRIRRANERAGLGVVDTYRVGFLRDLHVLWADARLGITTWPYAIRTLLRRVSRSWRRRSYWAGWLAEPRQLPDGLSRCGSGWTRVRSLRSLARLADQH